MIMKKIKNIKLDEIKNGDKFLSCFPNIKMGNHKLNIDYLDNFFDISSLCIEYLMCCAMGLNKDKITFKDFIGEERFNNVPKELFDIIKETNEDLNDLVNFKLKNEINNEKLSNRELNKLDKNKYILMYNYGITSKYKFNSPGEYEDFRLLCNTYMVHLLLKDKSIEFPLKFLVNKYEIKSKKIVRYFIRKQDYIKQIILEKIKNNAPCIFNLLRDLYYAIEDGHAIDEYGNIHINNIPDSQLDIVDYVYKNFRTKPKKRKKIKLDIVKKAGNDPKKIKFLKEMWNLK